MVKGIEREERGGGANRNNWIPKLDYVPRLGDFVGFFLKNKIK
jgi:hypothetical protein